MPVVTNAAVHAVVEEQVCLLLFFLFSFFFARKCFVHAVAEMMDTQLVNTGSFPVIWKNRYVFPHLWSVNAYWPSILSLVPIAN
jgi:hypothetical protein